MKEIYGLLGFAARSRNIVFGLEDNLKAISKRKVFLVIVAEDLKTKDKVIRKLNSPIALVFGNVLENSKAIGKENRGIIGIKDKNLATQIRKKILEVQNIE